MRRFILLLALIFLPAAAHAQIPVPNGRFYTFTDAMMPRLLELLQMYDKIRANENNANMKFVELQTAKMQVHEDIRNGKLDALDVLKRYHSNIEVPSGFTYDPGCSRELNMAGAAFVSNEDIDAEVTALGSKKNVQLSDVAVLGKLHRSPTYLRAIAFYERKPGWKRIKEPPSAFPMVNFEGPAPDTAAVSVYGLNQLSGTGHCKAKPGPMVMWSASRTIRQDEYEDDFGLNAALKPLAIDREAFQKIIFWAVYQAAMDVHNPENFQPPDGDDGGEYKNRKINAEWYKRYQAKLDPIMWKE